MEYTKYQLNKPYPIVNNLSHNPEQAKVLLMGYSGAISEFTTVSQYAYHKIKCLRNKEVADTLQGIFLIETLHLELLGSCVNQLGIDPKYSMYIGDKCICWQSDVVNYEKSMSSMIYTDIQGEKSAVEYYEQTAKEIKNKQIEKLLLRLAEDEKLHVKMFEDLYYKYFR